MTTDISKIVVYNMKDGTICMGISEMDWKKKQINLKEACQFEKEKLYKFKIKGIYNMSDKKDISIKIKDFQSAYILD